AHDLASRGSKIEFSYNQDDVLIRLRSLSSQYPATLAILESILVQPAMDGDVLATLKRQALDQIDRRNEQAAELAARKLAEILFARSRVGYSYTRSDINAIQRQDLQETREGLFQKTWPIIALSGDIGRTQARSTVLQMLARLPGTGFKPAYEQKDSVPPAALQNFAEAIYLIEKDVPQAVVRMATRLPAHNSPDFYALQTGNYILGGGSFNSRLMKEIRVKRGLAYYAYSYNQFNRNYGLFYAGSASQNSSITTTIQLMLAEIQGMGQPVEQAELKLAKDSILNTLIFQFEDPADQLDNQIRFDRHGMPANYLQRFSAKINAQSAQDINAVFKRDVQARQMVIVVVGPASLKGELEKIRPVRLLQPEEPVWQKQP
ncbi:MAG: insulinase family protein, partial [Leptospiraceae bacterium]|nr:insulinase family protein [Leptospiraceae bacterium]